MTFALFFQIHGCLCVSWGVMCTSAPGALLTRVSGSRFLELERGTDKDSYIMRRGGIPALLRAPTRTVLLLSPQPHPPDPLTPDPSPAGYLQLGDAHPATLASMKIICADVRRAAPRLAHSKPHFCSD